MTKSALVAFPSTVATVIGPDAVPGGTWKVRLVAVAAVTFAQVEFKRTLLFPMVVSKFVPVTLTDAPRAADPGVKPAMVGARFATVNEALLVDEPAGAVTLIVPLVAPLGTVVTISVVLLEVTVATTPLNLTVFCDGVVLKPLP